MEKEVSLGNQLYSLKQPAPVFTHIFGTCLMVLAAIGMAVFFTYPLYESSQPGEYGGAIFIAVLNVIFLLVAFLPVLSLLEVQKRFIVFFEQGIQLGMHKNRVRLRYDELEKVEPYIVDPNMRKVAFSLLKFSPSGLGAAMAHSRTYWGVVIQKRGGQTIQVNLPNESTYHQIAQAIAQCRNGDASER